MSVIELSSRLNSRLVTPRRTPLVEGLVIMRPNYRPLFSEDPQKLRFPQVILFLHGILGTASYEDDYGDRMWGTQFFYLPKTERITIGATYLEPVAPKFIVEQIKKDILVRSLCNSNYKLAVHL